MGRPRKNRGCLVGRAGRQVIELEDQERDAQRWRRRKEVIARFAAEKTRLTNPEY
ncbi:Uncharacterised protein [uncultured archaeon]|nr:Uncharacterised protein [uncultured archaeon]